MKTLIAIPAGDKVHTLFTQSLVSLVLNTSAFMKNLVPLYDFAIGSLVYDARNQLVGDALGNKADRILWLDSDMVFEPDLLARLSQDMDETGADVVCGLFFGRRPPIQPAIYSVLKTEQKGDMLYIHEEKYENYPKDSLFEIAACGMAATLVSVDICRKIVERYGMPFSPLPGLGEDLSFCYRARELGASLMCDSSVKVNHLGLVEFGEADFAPGVEVDNG